MTVTHHYPLIKTEFIFLCHLNNSGVSPDSLSPNNNGSGSLPAQGEYNIRKGFFFFGFAMVVNVLQNTKLHTAYNHYLTLFKYG